MVILNVDAIWEDGSPILSLKLKDLRIPMVMSATNSYWKEAGKKMGQDLKVKSINLNLYNVLVQEFGNIHLYIAFEKHNSRKGMRRTAEYLYNNIFIKAKPTVEMDDEATKNKVLEIINETKLKSIVEENYEIIKETLDTLIADSGFIKSWAITSFNHTILDFYKKIWFKPKKNLELSDLYVVYNLSDKQIKENGLDKLLLKKEQEGVEKEIYDKIKYCVQFNNEVKKHRVKKLMRKYNNIDQVNEKKYLEISHPADPENQLQLFIFGGNNKANAEPLRYLVGNVLAELKQKIKLPIPKPYGI